MSDGTKIEWTDATWSPITGCSVVSAGCKNCYAMKLAGTRLQHHPSREGLTIDTSNGPVWNGQVRFNEQWLHQPLKWKRPRRIFVCAHGDLFHESVPDEWIDRVFAVMALAPWHTFQVLTKRAKRMREYLSDYYVLARIQGEVQKYVKAYPNWKKSKTMVTHMLRATVALDKVWPFSNVWLGVSVENQEAADERIPLLLHTPAAVRWISAEPLLGPVSFRWAKWHDWNTPGAHHHLDGIKGIEWVVAGGESGNNARPMHPQWARSLRDQCQEAGVAFHFKQWGEYVPFKGKAIEWPMGVLRFSAWHGPDMMRVGKKAAGRLLDGRTWDEYPGATS